MGRPELDVRVSRFETVREIDGAWPAESFAALLATMEYGDTSGLSAEELEELAVMSLQDRAPAATAEILLRYRTGDRLPAGRLQNVAHDLTEEKLWEHYADMTLHEELFHVASLAYRAFPQTFHTPDAVRLTVTIRPANLAGRTALARGVSEAFLARALADGMEPSAILRRLFAAPLAGDSFPEAESIVWQFETREADGGVEVDVVSSGYWLDPLQDVDEYRSNAHPDAIADEDE